jgi:hypothetical protein
MGTSSPNPVAFSPREFAALFKKEQTWGYRQIYSGKVKTITEYGRIMVPASEVERILASAARYEGQKKKTPRTKKELEAMKPELQTAWQTFVRQRRKGRKGKDESAVPSPAQIRRKAALKRLFGASNPDREK